MIKKFLFSVLFAFVAALSANAQMTDDQVVDYIKTHNAMGENQRQITTSLLQRGVTQDQILRLKSKYENSSSASSSVSSSEDAGRMRTNNGESEPSVSDSQENSKIKIFGHDIFRSKNLSFEPNMNIATPAKYVLGPGDEVLLDIYGASQVNSKCKVSPDGTIHIDKIGPVSVSGMTVTQAQNVVRSRIGAHYQGSSIKLTVGQTRTILVNVMGEVSTPGTYSLSAFSTVFNALYMAGGITDIGTMRNIKVSRNGKVITTVDVYDYIVNGKLTGNVTLQDNDVIMVGPYENLVEIVGKVKRPMFYEMKKNESIQSLLTLAGGFTGDAYKEKIRIERKGDEGLTVHNVDEKEFGKFHSEDGDVVVVLPVIERYKNMAKVSGAVFRPGSYKLGSGVTTVKGLVEQAGGLLEQALTARAVLHRMKEDRTLMSITVDLDGVLRGTVSDIELQNEDELIIASAESINQSRVLVIEGEVVNPGTYKYSENETIEDLITEAGGLRESASIENVEVARRLTTSADNPDGNQIAKVFTFNLTEGLSVKNQTDFVLQPFDYVTIHRNPDYQVQRRVKIVGEVKFAGSYILSSKDERLSDIVKRAGGLTNKAHVDGARFVRKFTRQEQELKYQKLEMATTHEDSVAVRNDINKTTYGVGVDFSKAIKSPGSLDDIVLVEGDSIFVPKMNSVVKISGEVLYPNTVSFADGKSNRYYLNQAGGVARTGQKSLAYIVYPNGEVSTLKKGKVKPGCEIVVPQKVEKKVDSSKVGMWATLASTMATVGAVIASIVR